MGLRMLTNSELSDLLDQKTNIEIMDSGSKEKVPGCLVASDNEPETYIFYRHGMETKAKLPWEIVVAEYPIYSKERHVFVNRTIKKFERALELGLGFENIPAKINYGDPYKNIEPRICLQHGTPLYITSGGQLKIDAVGGWSTSYSSLAFKKHNNGANALNNVGIRTATSIVGP